MTRLTRNEDRVKRRSCRKGGVNYESGTRGRKGVKGCGQHKEDFQMSGFDFFDQSIGTLNH